MGAASSGARARSQNERVPGCPYAGVNRIRFEGCTLSPASEVARSRTPPGQNVVVLCAEGERVVSSGGPTHAASVVFSHSAPGACLSGALVRHGRGAGDGACHPTDRLSFPTQQRRDPACWARAGPGPGCWAPGASGSARAWAPTAGVAGYVEAGAAADGVGCAGDGGPQASRSLGERQSWQKVLSRPDFLRISVYEHVPGVLGALRRQSSETSRSCTSARIASTCSTSPWASSSVGTFSGLG